MTPLSQCCEPLFQLVCRLRRSVEHRVAIDFATFRKDMAQAWGETDRRAAAMGKTAELDSLRPLLFHFVDECVGHSRWLHAAEWKQEAFGREARATGVNLSFVDTAERWLRASGPEVADLLGVVQSMIALGFPLPPAVRTRLWSETGRRLEALGAPAGRSPRQRLFAAAYERTDRRDFVTPAGPRVGLLVLLAASVVFVLLAVNVLVFRIISGDLRQTLTEIADRTSAR